MILWLEDINALKPCFWCKKPTRYMRYYGGMVFEKYVPCCRYCNRVEDGEYLWLIKDIKEMEIQ